MSSANTEKKKLQPLLFNRTVMVLTKRVKSLKFYKFTLIFSDLLMRHIYIHVSEG